MNEELFVQKREADWQRLTILCNLADNSPAMLKPSELQEFLRLYRRTSSDLARLRTESTNPQLLYFLNELCGRAYSQIYRTPNKPIRKALGDSITLAAQTVRKCRIYIYVSLSILILGGFFAAGVLALRPDLRSHVVPPGFEETFEHWKSGASPDRDAGQSIAATAMYATNNPRVSIISGAVAAATFGVGTAYLLYYNGAMVGALSYEMAEVGRLGYLWGSITPHGVTEIMGIVISGAGGLVMGWALINPGRKRRGEALLDAGKDAIVLLCIGVVQTLMAAPIEGFLSFNPDVPMFVKVGFAIITFAGWILFWRGYGHSDAETTAAGAPLAT